MLFNMFIYLSRYIYGGIRKYIHFVFFNRSVVYIFLAPYDNNNDVFLRRPSRLLGVQVRAVRAGGRGAAVPVAARQREQRLPRQNQEGEETHLQGDHASSLHRPNVLQTSGSLHARVNINLKSTRYSIIYVAGR